MLSNETGSRQKRTKSLYHESHALIIWQGNYQRWSKLENTENEAMKVRDELMRQGFKVILSGNQSGDQIRSQVNSFIAKYGYQPKNRLLIFFTGHGHTRKKSTGYLVPVDAPDPNIDKEGFLKVAIAMVDVMSWARKIESLHVLFVFDSCFSGTIFESKSKFDLKGKYVASVINKPVRQFIAAGDAGQEVPAKSIFTPLFINAIQGFADYNDDGYVTGTEIGYYLTQNLYKYTSSQSPQYGKIRDADLDRGDIIFFASRSRVSKSSLPNSSEEQSDAENLAEVVKLKNQQISLLQTRLEKMSLKTRQMATRLNYIEELENKIKLVENQRNEFESKLNLLLKEDSKADTARLLQKMNQSIDNANQNTDLLSQDYPPYNTPSPQIPPGLNAKAYNAEEYIASTYQLILDKLDLDITRQSETIARLKREKRSMSEGPSVDIETLKLKRLVDKRSQIYDSLQQIIDKYNQTAKGIIDSIGR